MFSVAQLFVFVFITGMSWFEPYTALPDEMNYDTFQGTAVFQLSCFQYMSLAIVHSKGGQ
jgi:hypothetical protein